MNKPFIFFDCWFTLFTSDIVDDLTRMSALLGVPFNKQFAREFERSFMLKPGIDLRPSARRLQVAMGAPANPDVIADIVSILEAGLERQRPFPETLSVLAKLRETHGLGLITNSSETSLARLRATFALDGRFDVIVPSYEVGVIKPDPKIFRFALHKAGVSAADAMMVGDSPTDDFAGAQHAGMAAVLIDRRDRYPGHPRRITSLDQLDKFLTSANI